MILRIDHVAIAVKEFDKAFAFFTDLLGAVPGASLEDPRLKYRWQLMSMGDLSRIELLKTTGAGSFLEGFLANKEGGVHHITMQTADLQEAAKTLKNRGIPYFGYHEYDNNWKELFIHPRDAFGVLIQIAEFNADDWLSPEVKIPENKKFKVSANDGGCAISFEHPGGGKVNIGLSREEIINLRDQLEDLLSAR